MRHQLPLQFEFNNEMTFDSFQVGNNQEVLSSLQLLIQGVSDSCLYIWGGASVGKSHLMQAVCQSMAAQGKPISYIPLNIHQQLSPLMLDGLEQLPLVCIDDVENIAGLGAWEEGLFHLFNRVRDQGGSLLISGNTPPAQLPLQLLDLKSRLGWGVVMQISALSDEQKIVALQTRAEIRGMGLSDEVGRYLLNRYSRDMLRLMGLLDVLDAASMSEQRRLTIPFVRQYLD